MAAAPQIPLPAPLKTTNLASDWKRFKGQWTNYVKAAKLDREDGDRQAAIFLACIGSDAYELYATMDFADEQDRENPVKLLEAFENHCVGEVNEVYERYVLHSRQQEPGETFDVFLGDLRRLIKTCEYGTAEESTIRDRIVLGIRDDATRKKLLQTRKLTLIQAIDICRSSEATMRQLKTMTKESEDLHALTHQQRRRFPTTYSRQPRNMDNRDIYRPTQNAPKSYPPKSSDQQCQYCGQSHKPSKYACPAFGKSCAYCTRPNHHSSMCRSRRVTPEVKELQESDEFLMALDTTDTRRLYSHILVNGLRVKFLLDCGSSVNILPSSIYTKLVGSKLRPPRATLRMFNRQELKTLGMLTATVRHPLTHKELDMDFYITERESPILGIDACRQMDLLRVVEENICEIREDSASALVNPQRLHRITETEVYARYADLFDGSLGMLRGDVCLEIDPLVPPVRMPLRRLPVAVRDKIEAELQRLTADGVIAPITEPTPWVSALLVVAKSNGSLRICIDPKPLNKALQRSTYYIPTIDDVLPKLAGVKAFSTVDIKQAFWHLRLDDASSRLTTFETPFGRYRWLRLPFGISPAPEIWQSRVHAAISGLKGIFCIADDILVTGSGDTAAEAALDHDANLVALLDRCREQGLKLNREKFQLNRSVITFMGHELTNEGLRPDPKKIIAIQEMPVPTDKAALQRLLGMVTYLARFCPHFSQITAPLRELLAADNEFRFDVRHREAFKHLKEMLASAPVLHYFRPGKPLTIQADASQAGLGAALMQEGQVIEYASRAMTSTEQAYAQIEKELLAIVFALERFDTYAYAGHVTIETDHKPLLAIDKKALASAPKRLQRMLLRLQRYSYELIYRPGSELILADTLSRAYAEGNPIMTKFTEEIASLGCADEEQVVDLQLIASPDTVSRLMNAARDDDYQLLIRQIRVGFPENPAGLPTDLRPYHTFADELTVSGGIAFKGNRIIVPPTVRPYILERLHSAHIGVNGITRRAREIAFWPGLTSDIKRVSETCDICARYQQSIQKEPLLSHAAPSRPWQKVSADILTFADRDYLVTVDFLSGFFEVDRLPSKKVADITYCLRQHFARHGLPNEVITDNSPFCSQEFKRFAERYDFQHVTSSPRYPQSNGRAENAVKIVKRLLTKAKDDNSDPLLAILEWRNIPSEHSGLSPAQILFGRRTRTSIPIANRLLETATSNAAEIALSVAKARQAHYYNRGAKARPPLVVGQTVRVKYDHRPDWRKGEIAEALPHRSYAVRFEDGTTRRRTSRHIASTSEPPIILDDDSEQSPDAAVPAANLSQEHNRSHVSQPLPSSSKHSREPEPVITRSGRVVKIPSRYRD